MEEEKQQRETQRQNKNNKTNIIQMLKCNVIGLKTLLNTHKQTILKTLKDENS